MTLLPELPTFELGYPEIDFANEIGVVASARAAIACRRDQPRKSSSPWLAPGPRERLRDLVEPADKKRRTPLRSCYAPISNAYRALSRRSISGRKVSQQGAMATTAARSRGMKRSSGAHHISPQIT